jgi:serine phosphatase RsbU (regulator of sigma subunit)
MSNIFKQIINNLTTRIMLIIYLSIIFISAFFITFGYYNHIKLLQAKEYEKLMNISTSIAVSINGDEHEKMMNENLLNSNINTIDDDSSYHNIHKLLSKYQTANNFDNPIYTLVYDSTKNVFNYGVRSDSFVDFRNEYKLFPKVLLDSMNYGGIIPRYKSENGEFLSAFYPIFNKENKVIALLEADVEFGQFRIQVFDKYKIQALVSFSVIFIIAMILIPYTKKILKAEEKSKFNLLTQKQIIEVKNNDINDSINYAQKIQEALLPNIKNIEDTLPKTFIYYKPKDVVSGDFYWFKKVNDITLLASVDCTGHGIPGAFMSIIGHSKLDAIISHNKITDPGKILDLLENSINSTFSSKKHSIDSKDGMDVALCAFDLINKQVKYAGAFRPLFVVNGNDIKEIKGNRFPIGGGESYKKTEFTTHTIDINENDCFYMFSDGFSDQFGGPKDKKFMNKRFKQVLIDIQHLPADEKVKVLDKTLVEWQGDIKQIDDILVIGVCFNK